MNRPLRVVIADDEPLALERLALAFRDIEGAEVVGAAASGLQALEMIAALRPDLAVLDIQMPGRTGLGVAAALPPDGRRSSSSPPSTATPWTPSTSRLRTMC